MLSILTIYLAVVAVPGNAMNIFKNDFEQQWEELFKDVNKLNEYTKARPVELRGVDIDNYRINEVIFTGATFDGVTWKNVSAKKSRFIKVIFKNCTFEDVNFEDSIMTDVTFENCKIHYSNFSGCTMVRSCFRDCDIVETALDGTDGDILRVDKCSIKTRSAFSGSKIQFEFRDTNMHDVNMMGLNGGYPLLIEGGTLSEVDFGKSHFSTVTLRRVKQGEGGVKFNDITAKSVTFESVDMTHGTAIARSRVKSVIVNGGNFGTTFDDSIIGAIYVRDAELYYMEFSEVKLPKVTISNCKLYDTGLYDGFIEEFSVYNSEFNIIVGDNFKADTVVWDNVTLDGKIDLTNAHVEDFQVTRLKRGPKLQLITTGSNLKF